MQTREGAHCALSVFPFINKKNECGEIFLPTWNQEDPCTFHRSATLRSLNDPVVQILDSERPHLAQEDCGVSQSLVYPLHAEEHWNI